MPGTSWSVEDRLAQLMGVGSFMPPPEFTRSATVRDPAAPHAAAASGPDWWAEQARLRLDWDLPFRSVLGPRIYFAAATS